VTPGADRNGSANTFFTIGGAKSAAGVFAMAEVAQHHPERRRSVRTALHLDATLRENSRKAPARVIDISTHGCRVACSTVIADGSWVWLGIAGLQNQRARVAWHCEEFIGLEFETPLNEAVFERLLHDKGQLPEAAIHELRSIASRTHWLARQAADDDIAILADISRTCAEEAVIEGLSLRAPKGIADKR
jgi:hypothetical protein